MANFTGYYKTPDSPTAYGVAEGGQRVAFQDPTQLAEAQGGATADFGQVKVDPTFNPAGAINYSDYIKGLNQPTSNPTQQALQAAQASGPAPQTEGTANTALEAFAPKAPSFYKPTTPVPGFDPATVFDAQNKPLSYDQFIAAGGKPDFSNVQAGSPPTQALTSMGSSVTPTTPLVSPVVDLQLQNDPGYQQLLKDRAEFNSIVNQNKSLTDTYTELTNQLGIPALNTQLMNMKNVIDGTEEDIRAEVTKAGGFATESQVLALTNARNKQLIKNYNNLLNTKQQATETLNNMINLAGQDRQFAMSAINQKLQLDQQIIDYQQKMQANARETYNKIVDQVGYAGLQQMTGGDPYYTSLVEKTLGLGSGGLAQLAAYKKPLTESEKLDLAVKQANINQSKSAIAKNEAETYKILHPDAKTEIIDKGGRKFLVDSNTGAVIKEVAADIGTGSGEQSDYQIQTNQRILQSVDELLPRVNSGVVGPLGLVKSKIPGTEAYNFAAELETLKSNIAFGALTAMREASKSGGALGQVSDKEGKLLESSLAALSLGQSPENFKGQLEKIKASINRWNASASNGGQEIAPPETVKMQGTDGKEYYVPNDKVELFKQNGYKPISFNSAGNASASNKIVMGYDLSTYATDPNHVSGIKSIINKIGDSIESFIGKINGSPITPNMIYASAQKYQVDPKLLTALLVQESSLGTKGRAVSTKNPGNVGNTDSGAKKQMSSWQAGVDAAAYQLARRKIG